MNNRFFKACGAVIALGVFIGLLSVAPSSSAQPASCGTFQQFTVYLDEISVKSGGIWEPLASDEIGWPETLLLPPDGLFDNFNEPGASSFYLYLPREGVAE